VLLLMLLAAINARQIDVATWLCGLRTMQQPESDPQRQCGDTRTMSRLYDGTMGATAHGARGTRSSNFGEPQKNQVYLVPSSFSATVAPMNGTLSNRSTVHCSSSYV